MKKYGCFMQKKYVGMLFAYLSSWVICILGNMADTIIAGVMLNSEAVSAVELITPFFSILMFFMGFTAIGTSILYSRTAGEFDAEGAKRVCGTGIVSAVAFSALLGIGMILLEDAYFVLYSASPAIEALAREYYEGMILTAVIYPVYWTVYYLIGEDGDAASCVTADTTFTVVNIAASALLAASVGIRGIALGTVIGMAASGLSLLLHFLKKKNSLHFRFCFDPGLFFTSFRLGSVTSLMYLFIGLTDVVVNKFVIVRFGDAYLPVYAVINVLLNFVGCFMCSDSAAGPFIGVGFGEKNPLAVKKVMRMSTAAFTVLGAVFSLGLEIAAPLIPPMYDITDPELAGLAVYAVRVLAASYLPTAYVVNWFCFFARTDRVLHGTMISAMYMLISPLIFPPLFVMLGWGFKGLIWGFFLTPFAAVLYHFLYTVFRFGIRSFPYIIPPSENRIFLHEIAVNEEEVIGLCAAVEDELRSCGADDIPLGKVRLVLEESFLIVRDKNPGKRILADCTLIVNPEYVQLITRDNGVIFDVTDYNAEIRSLREYMNAMLNKNGLDSSYMTTTSFNRNSYFWERVR